MTNIALLCSSIVCGGYYIKKAVKENELYSFASIIYLLAVVTSILNHGLTSKFAMCLDRIFITIVSLISLKYIFDIEGGAEVFMLMVAALVFFLIAKIYEANGDIIAETTSHMIAHIVATMASVLLLKYVTAEKKN